MKAHCSKGSGRQKVETHCVYRHLGSASSRAPQRRPPVDMPPLGCAGTCQRGAVASQAHPGGTAAAVSHGYCWGKTHTAGYGRRGPRPSKTAKKGFTNASSSYILCHRNNENGYHYHIRTLLETALIVWKWSQAWHTSQNPDVSCRPYPGHLRHGSGLPLWTLCTYARCSRNHHTPSRGGILAAHYENRQAHSHQVRATHPASHDALLPSGSQLGTATHR